MPGSRHAIEHSADVREQAQALRLPIVLGRLLTQHKERRPGRLWASGPGPAASATAISGSQASCARSSQARSARW